MFNILEQLRVRCRRDSTKENYYTIWKLFNKFILKLDIIPGKWEDRVFLFLANLVNEGKKSSTVHSYFSAIKAVLFYNGYELSYDLMQLKAITKACRLINDKLQTKLPIRLSLMEQILFEIGREYDQQPYLKCLYQTIIAIAYFGLFRIGEVTKGDHVVKARNVFLGQNKNKVLFVLYTSKTHSVDVRPQKVKIAEARQSDVAHHFCPFDLINRYFKLRGDYTNVNEQFFIYRDGSAVEPATIREVLSKAIKGLGLDSRLYSFHGLRAGRATDLFHWGFTLEQIKIIGRWKSNAIYRYLKM